MTLPLQRWQVNVDTYHQMIEKGILTENDRVELINGEIITMSPINPSHSGKVNRLSNFIIAKLNLRAIVAVQNPVILSEFSEPQPDIAILKNREDHYEISHPTPEDILHIIEIAQSSLKYDRELKLPLYAAAGIPSYLIVDVEKHIIEVYSNPEGNIYKNKFIANRNDQIELADVQFNAKDLLG